MHVVRCQVAQHALLKLYWGVWSHPVSNLAGFDLLVDKLLHSSLEALFDRVQFEVRQVPQIFLAAIEVVKLGHHQLKNFIPTRIFALLVVLWACFLKLRFVVTSLWCHIGDSSENSHPWGFLLQEILHNGSVVAWLSCLACHLVMSWSFYRV